jgi:hypothetical protein
MQKEFEYLASLRVRDAACAIRRISSLLLVLVVAVGLSACAGGTLSGVFSGSSSNKKPTAPVSFAPIIGAPSNISDPLSRELVSESRKQKISVITDTGKSADYTVRGYLAASQDQKTNKLAYIWDVTDQTGKRVHRILGEEVTPAKQGRDAWATFDQKALNKIATKTATDLAAWLPKTGGADAPQPAVASRPPASAEKPATARKPAPQRTITARAPKGPVMARVPNVRGAPGDGSKSLTQAIKKQLFAQGLKLTSGSGSNVYTVNGTVKVGRPTSGQQTVKIDWVVNDPQGQKLGTVTQANKVPKGTLDGKWGPIADAAASSAADGIVKLIPKR